MSTLFMIWILLTVLAPHPGSYKAYFFLIMVPCTLILLISKRVAINWKDPQMVIAQLFFLYAAVATFDIGSGPIESHYRALRWSIEISVGVVVLFVFMKQIVLAPKKWSRFFLWACLIGALAAILFFVLQLELKGRLTGLGIENPVKFGSLLTIYFALGLFLLLKQDKPIDMRTKLLAMTSFITVLMAVLMTQSRSPIAALGVFTVFIGGLILYEKQRNKILPVVIMLSFGLALVLGLLEYFFGLETFIEKLLNRGLSHRVEIWTGYLRYPPDSLLLGWGSGTPAELHPAKADFGKHSWHPHSLWLGTWVDTGFIGLGFLMAMWMLVLKSIIQAKIDTIEKWQLVGIMGLVFMVTLTGTQTVISSIKVVWFIFWLPFLFIWFWCRYRDDQITEYQQDLS